MASATDVQDILNIKPAAPKSAVDQILHETNRRKQLSKQKKPSRPS